MLERLCLRGVGLCCVIAAGLAVRAAEPEVIETPPVDSADIWVESSTDPAQDEPLPPLEEELWLHGGAHMYESQDELWGDYVEHCAPHAQLLRLPEWWEPPRPLTAFQEFLGSDPIYPWPGLQWFGERGYQWEPRFVGYGSYEVFGIALEDGGRRQDGIGHQLLVDLDLRVTGTERAHVQFRPLGRKNSGGSFYQFSDPAGYQDNSTLIPDRWWIEGEFYSLFGGLIGPTQVPLDYHFVAGKFPFALHNNLLINDDITGFVINKNTLLIGDMSNLNLQGFFAFDDVDAFDGAAADLYGAHATIDYRQWFLEATLAGVEHARDPGRNAVYGGFSATQFFGPTSVAGRMLFKGDDDAGRGDGQLYVLETNHTRAFSEEGAGCTGIEQAVFYLNMFKATSGWNSISGGNFDRLRSTFEVDPLVSIARGQRTENTIGAALGVQLFRHHEDESFVPEIAYEEPAGTSVWGVGLQYLRKLGPRTFLQARGVRTWSSDEIFEREGVFVSTFVVF